MAEREQVRRSTPSRDRDEIVDAPSTNEETEGLTADIDDMLDEIDEVLESNAEDFVRSYVQKGGE